MIDSGVLWLDRYARVRDVSMKMTAATVVALLKNVDAPALPKSVWLPPPPKAAPMSAPFPVWRRTIMIRAMHTITCNMIKTIAICIFRVLFFFV
jgi:hypothetical protein